MLRLIFIRMCDTLLTYFLCCDGLWLSVGSESGRSSPFYGQEGRSSTPTTNQPPKHFHVPGRYHLLITPLLIMSFHSLSGEKLFIHYECKFRRKVTLSYAAMKVCKNVLYFHTACDCFNLIFPSRCTSIFLCHLSSSTFQLFISSFHSHRRPQHLQEASHL